MITVSNLRHLGGKFIELTTHAFFILDFSEFDFEDMSKLTNLDWNVFCLTLRKTKKSLYLFL